MKLKGRMAAVSTAALLAPWLSVGDASATAEVCYLGSAPPCMKVVGSGLTVDAVYVKNPRLGDWIVRDVIYNPRLFRVDTYIDGKPYRTTDREMWVARGYDAWGEYCTRHVGPCRAWSQPVTLRLMGFDDLRLRWDDMGAAVNVYEPGGVK